MSYIAYPKLCVSADGYRENPERGTNLYRAEDGTPWIYNAWPETRYTFDITHPALCAEEQLELEQFYDQHIGDEVGWDNPRRQERWIVRMVGPPRLAGMRDGLRGDVEMTLVGYRGVAPTYSVPPVVSGLHQIGQVISISQGTWQSEYPMQFEYQWLRNGEPIAGATDQNYTLVDDDLFDMISVRVTASSLGGSTSVETEPVRARLDSVVSWLYSDMAETIFVDVEGNTPATWGDPVGLVKDSSGNGNDFTQPTVTARPILRNDPPRLEFDLTDDNLTTTLPAIENGTVVIAGTNGIWIDDDYNFAGGTFSIGPTSYTNGPQGILTAIGDPIERGFLVINRQLTQLERELVIQEMKERGAPGVFELGPELTLVSEYEGTPITDPDDTSADGTAVIATELLAGVSYRLSYNITGYDGVNNVGCTGPAAAGYFDRVRQDSNGSYTVLLTPTQTGSMSLFTRRQNTATFTNVSLRKLELVP